MAVTFRFGMARLAIVAVATLLATPASAKAAHLSQAKRKQAERPTFTFKDVTAEQAVDAQALSGCQSGEIEGLVRCRRTDETVAGVSSFVGGLVYVYYKSRLAQVTFDFLHGSDDFEKVMLALADKYGKPCQMAYGRWINAVDIAVDYPIIAWCFRTGKLTLSKFSLTRDISAIDYTDQIMPTARTSVPKDF